jgi:tRNA 2-thiouridine synthesizing protein A
MLFSWFGRNRRKTKQTDMQAIAVEKAEVDIPGVGAVTVARTVNCIGDGCPKPQLMTLKALNQVEDGDIVELVSDNPTAVETIPAMMLSAYGSHLATVRAEGCWKVYVRKGM